MNDQLPRDCFEQIARAYLASGRRTAGPVGGTSATLLESPQLVHFCVAWPEDWFG